MVILTWLLKLLSRLISLFEGQPPSQEEPSPPVEITYIPPGRDISEEWRRRRRRFRNR